ncbi:rRNA maturation RNase YbeY [bacterium]|nr:rRNA maturation RNase YbeY [bacterium]
MLVEVNNVISASINKKWIRDFLLKAADIIKGRKIDVLSVALVDNSEIKKWNRKYRGENKITDVLSFDDPAEIIICWPRLIKQAKMQAHSRRKELAILLAHGFLHILGYDHKTKKQALLMQKKADKILEQINIRTLEH